MKLCGRILRGQSPCWTADESCVVLQTVPSKPLLRSGRMLNEMEDDLDTADANLNLVTAKTKQLIQQSGGKRNFAIIVVLSIVVVVLFFLILYS